MLVEFREDAAKAIGEKCSQQYLDDLTSRFDDKLIAYIRSHREIYELWLL
jgi:hypothetical protein